MINDTLDNWREYVSGAAWSRVFEFLAKLDAHAPDEDRIELDGDRIFARVMSYVTKTREEAVLEAHDRHIDVQVSLSNSEAIECHERGRLEIKTPYDPEKDVVFFRPPDGFAARVVNSPGRFTVLFPQDAHMPQLMTGRFPESVKKVVVKVSVEAGRMKAEG